MALSACLTALGTSPGRAVKHYKNTITTSTQLSHVAAQNVGVAVLASKPECLSAWLQQAITFAADTLLRVRWVGSFGAVAEAMAEACAKLEIPFEIHSRADLVALREQLGADHVEAIIQDAINKVAKTEGRVKRGTTALYDVVNRVRFVHVLLLEVWSKSWAEVRL